MTDLDKILTRPFKNNIYKFLDKFACELLKAAKCVLQIIIKNFDQSAVLLDHFNLQEKHQE